MSQFKASLFFVFGLVAIVAFGTAFSHLWRVKRAHDQQAQLIQPR